MMCRAKFNATHMFQVNSVLNCGGDLRGISPPFKRWWDADMRVGSQPTGQAKDKGAGHQARAKTKLFDCPVSPTDFLFLFFSVL